MYKCFIDNVRLVEIAIRNQYSYKMGFLYTPPRLKRSPRMPKGGCSNPSRDRPKS